MKRISVSFLILCLCLVSVAWSQSLPVAFSATQTIPPGTFKHIIIVIQENRTPDNLFGAGASGLRGCGLNSPGPFESGIDVYSVGAEHAAGTQHGRPSVFCNVEQPMNNGTTFDPGHFYGDWVADFDFGAMDGFCHDKTGAYITCPPSGPSPYSYVQQSDVQPYWDIAKAYGFANYMFQTNEGPSFPAHQFLFTGTSAPVAPNDSLNYYLDFVANNAQNPGGVNSSGCQDTGQYGYPKWVQPNGVQETDPRGRTRASATPTIVWLATRVATGA